MACSKKDYVAIAAIILGRTGLDGSAGCWGLYRTIAESIAEDLARYFGSQSQAFDKVRFLKACGIPQEQPGGHCAECGEVWPCSDSKRRDIMPTIVAKHRMGDR